MPARDPMTRLPTHVVDNQPPPLPPRNAYDTDRPLCEAVAREAPAWVVDYLRNIGDEAGSDRRVEQGFLANRHPPELVNFDPQGRRIDEVRYHPAYHALMEFAVEQGVHSIAWRQEGSGGHVAHVAALYLLTQPEQGYCCPVTMTHASIAALRHEPGLSATWEPKILCNVYDPRTVPATEKGGVTIGMAMTEKQGGSDVRSNATVAERIGENLVSLTGHKWFCSAPMSDAFLTLARLDEGLSCFLVPRWRPDGTRNPFYIQRLKDKCGNRANASAEIEYQDTWAHPVGEPGRGVRTIIEMVQQTRLDAATAPVGMMRLALTHALHHARHRRAFGARLVDQPLMIQVLADLALEVEAATALVIRVAGAMDRSGGDTGEALIARLATPVAKYWTNKRSPQAIYEAMECLGGGGYVEESVLPRLYREAPVNSIWEGSGNVVCLDVLRAMRREPDGIDALLGELASAGGGNRHFDRAVDRLKRELANPDDREARARRLVEAIALCLQGSLMLRHAPGAVADAWCATRLGGDGGFCYGTLPPGPDVHQLLDRASDATATAA